MRADPRRLSELEPHESADIFAQLAQREPGTTRDGKPYFRTAFRDRHRSASCMIWLDGGWFEDCEQHWRVGDHFKLRVRYFQNQYGPGIEIERWRPVEPADREAGFDPADFEPTTRFDVDDLFDELRGHAEREIDEPGLRELTLGLLEEHVDALKQLPAASRNHHAWRGGFLEHVVSVTRTATYFADKYRALYPKLDPPLSRSLVIAGAILHDIGKLLELTPGQIPSEYTAAGRLVGHILLGRDMIRDRAAQIAGFDREMLLRLEHILVSHQGQPIWGSPVPPSTPEALLVHYADDVDAKFQMVVSALEVPPGNPGEEFTGVDNPLKRRLFRGLADSEG